MDPKTLMKENKPVIEIIIDSGFIYAPVGADFKKVAALAKKNNYSVDQTSKVSAIMFCRQNDRYELEYLSP
jgi:hypothetical protein